MTDINKFSLGKDGKLGEIDFSKIKSGLKGSELIKDNEKLKSIFSRIDKNGDGKLDRTELDSLQELLADLSGDDNLSMKEAKKLEDEDGKLGRGGAKLLMELLNKMSEAAKTQGIKNVETRTGGGIEVVTYEDGHTEEVFEDGSVITTVKNGDKTTKTHKDKDGNLLNETVIEDGVETYTTYADGKKVKEVQTKENSVETTNYDSEGNPKDKTVTDKESGVVDSYEYKNGEFVLKKRVDSKNNSETVYDGDKETTTQMSDGTKTVTVKEDGELVRTTSTRTNENNETERTDTTYNGDDYIENFYVDDTVRRQKKVVDGKEYEVHYDANGNTEGVVVQNGESIALIAKRFGCSVEDLIKVNASKIRGKHPKVYFVVGEEIKIPGQMDAEDYAKIQAGRKSKAEAVGDYKDYIARIEEEKRIKAEQEAAEAQRKADEVAAQKEQEQKKEAKALAKELHDAIDEEHYAIGQSRFQTALRRVNKDNIVDVLKAYKEISPDLSLVKFIGQEFSAPTIRKDAVEYLAKTLYQKGIEVGVNKEELDKLLAEFKAEAKYQYITKVGKVDSAKLETILDAMLGSVIAKMQDAEEISDEEAIAQTAEMAQGDSAQAKSDFDTAREGEHWIAKSSDWVCGLFGCKTIGEMREKVGKHADEIEKLANAKDEVEFKKIFKEVFGVEFDKQKIAAYNTAVENYTQAYGYKSMIESVDTLILQGRTLSAGEFRDLIKEKFGYTDDEINQFIAAVGSDSGDLKEALTNALQLLKNTFQDNYNSITKGSSLEDMAQDIELIKKGVFGTNDIVKEVGIFNNNMQLTEAIGTGSLEILATVALAFIPGGQAAAGVRITAMVAKYGKLAVTLTRAAQTAVQAGIATYAVLKSDGRSVDEIKEHVKTNMAFAAGGVCSAAIAGRLAPIVAKTFKISGNVAKEVLEDAADMMASYVTSKGLGMEYGKTDAGVDMFMNFLMARLAHVQIGGKGVKAGNVPNKPNVAGELPEHQSTTKTLDKATSSGTAHPSEVRVGAKKAADIKNEVEEMLKNSDVSPEELARVRHEVGAIQDREMRRDLLRKIDEAASKLDPSAKATFDAARKANNKADFDHIFERHNELKNSDMRVLNEYIKSTDDIEALKELRTKLQTKEHEFGGATQSYKTLYESIDNRIKSLEVKVHHSAEKKVGEAPDAAQAPKAEEKADAPNAEEAPKAEKKADAPKAEEAPKAEKKADNSSKTGKTNKPNKKVEISQKKFNKAKEKINKKLEGINEVDLSKQDMSTKQSRLKKLGLALSNVFDGWVEKIHNLNVSDMVEIPHWIDNIKSQFKNFSEYGNQLLGYLKKKLNEIGDFGQKIVNDTIEGVSQVGSKLTKRLAKLRDKILDAINNAKNEKQFNKAATSINKHFSNNDDIFNNLWDKLKTKAAQLGINSESLIQKKVKTPYDNLVPQNANRVRNIAQHHNAAVVDVNFAPRHFKKGENFVLDLATNKQAQIALGPIISLDLSEPKLAKLLLNLQEGQSFTIGSFEGNATYKMGSMSNGVSRQHLVVTKKDGVYIFKDTSTYGTQISKNTATFTRAKDVKKMFPYDQATGSYYLNKVHKGGVALDSQDYKNIAELMNKCDGKYRKLWESTFVIDNGRNIDKLAAFEKLVRDHGTLDFYLNLDDRTWAVIVENICQKHVKAVDAIHNYKASSNPINLSIDNGMAYNKEIADYINNMTDYLNTQTINKNIKLFRGEQYKGSLDLIRLPNGMPVGQAMENLIKKGASQKEINAFVNKYLIGTKVEQNRFMSTAINEKFCEDWAKKNPMAPGGPNPNGSIVWEIDVPGETKGAFVEDFNTFYGEEYEVILQRNSILVIKGAYFDPKKRQWKIKAKVVQTPYNQIKRF